MKQNGKSPIPVVGYSIALVNNASRSNPEHWVEKVSKRRSRAIKQARELAKSNPNIILFADLSDGNCYSIGFR